MNSPAYIRTGWLGIRNLVLLLMFGFTLTGCAATDPIVGNDDGERTDEEDAGDHLSTLDEDWKEWSTDRSAIEEQYRFLVAQSYELEVRLEQECREGMGLTSSQEHHSKIVETLLIDFLKIVDAELGLNVLLSSDDQLDEVRNPELKSWAALRWGQIQANYSCILTEIGYEAGYAKQLPRGQHKRRRNFLREGYSTTSWISYFEIVENVNIAPWSEIAEEWLAVEAEEEAPMFTICGVKVEELRTDVEVGTEARETACEDGYEWACDWLEKAEEIDD